jgi:hypothetical protein
MSNESGNKPVVPHKKHVARLQREKQQTRLILYTFFGILGAVILLLVYGWLDATYLKLNKAVAKVGEAKITVSDFEPRVRLQRQNFINQFIQYQQYQQFGLDVSSQLQSIQFQLDNPETIGENVINVLIDEEIIRQEAAKRGITASEEEINEALQNAFGYFPNGIPTPLPTGTSFATPELPADALKILTPTLPSTSTPEATATTADETPQPTTIPATSTPLATPTVATTPLPSATPTPYTEDQFNKRISDVNKNLTQIGFDEAFFRNFFEIQILEKKLREQVITDIPAMATQVRARHILVADEQVARDIIKRLQSGEDFAELAITLSTDTASAVQGGDLGWFGKGQMVADFETAAFALEKSGDITIEPVKSSFGYHIIQLVAKREIPMSPDQIQQEQTAKFRTWLDGLREAYSVEIYDEVWKQNTPKEPNFITAATQAAVEELTAQAEQIATFQAVTLTPIP